MAHSWKFFRAGGFDQVHFTSGSDLVSIGELDQKLWVALACPVKGLEFDTRTLELLDTEKDGRIRATELIAAAKFAGANLKNPEDLMKGADTLQLSAIDDSKPDGKRLLTAAKELLKSINKADATALSVADCTAAQAAFLAQRYNGDGVMPAESAPDADSKAAIEDLVKCLGPVTDRGGKPGIDAKSLEKFTAEGTAYLAWAAKGEGDKAVMVLGADTASAHAALEKVRKKVDDYFSRCALTAFDARATVAVNREEKEFIAIGQLELDESGSQVAGFPLAAVGAGKALPLADGVNPAWRAAIAELSAKAVEPLLGKKPALTEAEWSTLKGRFEAYRAHLAAKAGASVDPLGVARVKALSNDWVSKLGQLIADDKAQEPVAQSLNDVEKLVRLNRDLLKLANNFVAFRDFYSKQAPASFQAGTLYLDTRAFELCLRVEDAARHASMAPLARCYLMYCDCARPASGEKMSIVAGVTGGDVDNLMVGRNGIFYDRQGRDWDATVTKIVDNPISIRQAFWAPYKKLIRFIEEQVAKRAAAAASASEGRLISNATHVDKSVDTGKVTPEAGKLDVGVVAALGVAVGGITAALGALLQAFFGLGIWMPLGLIGGLLLISGPSMAVAWLKLRQRNLGPLLDANGWAVNAVAKMNVPFGGSLTKEAKLPPGSSRQLHDPFAEKQRPWGVYLFLVALLALGIGYYLGKLDTLLPPAVRSGEVLKGLAPHPAAAPTPTPAAPAAPPAAPPK
ncbi:MAG: hypothetical protein QM723_38250 [Myxococcaceae bacterium]